MVVNVSSKNMPFSQKPTCQPFVLYNELIIMMFRLPKIKGCAKYVIANNKAKPMGGMYPINPALTLLSQA